MEFTISDASIDESPALLQAQEPVAVLVQSVAHKVETDIFFLFWFVDLYETSQPHFRGMD